MLTTNSTDDEESRPLVEPRIAATRHPSSSSRMNRVDRENRARAKDEGSREAYIVFIVLGVFITSFVLFSNGFTTEDLDTGLANTETVSRLQMAKDREVKFSSLSDEDQYTLFQDFQGTYKKKYETKHEEKNRMKYFQDFIARVDDRNSIEKASGGTAVHGLTIFSDLSPDEFKSNYMGYIPPKSSNLKYQKVKMTVDAPKSSVTSADWTGVYTTAVNNQQYCGSCWAFSVTQQIESDAIRAGLITADQPLSVQQLISCDNKFNDLLDKSVLNYGCQGGNTEQGYAYVTAVGGLTLASEYEYTSGDNGVTGTCRTAQDEYVVAVDTYYALASEDDMQNYVLSTGPLSVCIDATYWESYQSGIVHSCGTDVNHCVQVVGVDVNEGYWKVRNTWGTEWGEEGYIRLALGLNTCAIANDPTYAKVSVAGR